MRCGHLGHSWRPRRDLVVPRTRRRLGNRAFRVAFAVRRPCSDFMDMLRRLISCRIITIIQGRRNRYQSKARVSYLFIIPFNYRSSIVTEI